MVFIVRDDLLRPAEALFSQRLWRWAPPTVLPDPPDGRSWQQGITALSSPQGTAFAAPSPAAFRHGFGTPPRETVPARQVTYSAASYYLYKYSPEAQRRSDCKVPSQCDCWLRDVAREKQAQSSCWGGSATSRRADAIPRSVPRIPPQVAAMLRLHVGR